MKASWTGYVSFGLVNVPVKVFKATEDRSVRFHQVHAADGGRIKQQKTCGDCGEILAAGDIVRGLEGVTFTDSELERGLAGVRGIDIVRFVDAAMIDPALVEATFYLGPDDTSSGRTRLAPSPAMLGGYKLLVTAMQAEQTQALARVTVRERQRMGIVRVMPAGVLALDLLRWSDEIRAADVDYLELLADVTLPPEQIDMARRLVANMKLEALELDEFHDTYRERIEGLVAAKLAGTTQPTVEAEPAAAVIDLIAALEASVAASEPRQEAAV